MRLIELFLNGQLVDLPATTKGLLKFSQARAALADVAARIGEYSFPFTLPATRRNAVALGVDKLHPLGLNKFGYYTDYGYELRVEGQVFTGIARLSSLKNGYTLTLLGEGLSWALLLGESTLNDLQFPLVAYDGSQLESILAKDCDSTDLQFPLVAWGNFFHPPSTTTDADGNVTEVPSPPAAVLDYPLSVDDYPPGVYYGNVLRQIFAGIGWQLQSRELDSEFWRAVVHTCAGADLGEAWNWGTLLKASAAGSSSAFSYYDPDADNYSNSRGSVWDGQAGEIIFLPLACPLTASPTRALSPELAAYTAPRAGVYRFEWAATLSSGHQSWKRSSLAAQLYEEYFRPVGLGLVVRRGGQDYTGADGGLCTNLPGGPANGYAPGQDRVLTPQRIDVPTAGLEDLQVGATFGGPTGDVYLEAGDVVQLATFVRRRILAAGNPLLTRREFVTEWAGVSLACTHYEDDNGVSKELIQPADFLPPLLCRDVVRDMLQRTNSFILADSSRRLATIVSRAELSTAGGPPIDLTERCDLRAGVEYLPAAGAGTGSFVFSQASNQDEPLPVASDVVSARIGPGDGQQSVSLLYAPVAFRQVYFSNGLNPVLPTCSTKDILAQERSAVEWDIASQPPRLVRYTGFDTQQPVPFMLGAVPLGRAVWDGVLCWDGVAGGVGTYYADVLKRALKGHTARLSITLSPALYRSLRPGKRVYVAGAGYSVAGISNFDPADEAGLCSLDLEREVL